MGGELSSFVADLLALVLLGASAAAALAGVLDLLAGVFLASVRLFLAIGYRERYRTRVTIENLA